MQGHRWDAWLHRPVVAHELSGLHDVDMDRGVEPLLRLKLDFLQHE